MPSPICKFVIEERLSPPYMCVSYLPAFIYSLLRNTQCNKTHVTRHDGVCRLRLLIVSRPALVIADPDPQKLLALVLLHNLEGAQLAP